MKAFTIVFFFFITSQSVDLSFYIERNPNNRKSSDYLSLLISDNNSTTRAIFKLPHRLSHQESFNIRICETGTYDTLLTTEHKEEFLKQNCLNDKFNTIAEVNYNVSTILDQKINSDIFKLCVFGFAFPEAEQSFLMSSIYELETQKELKGPNLYYRDTEQIVQLVKYAENTQYKKLYEQKQFQCQMEFNDEFDWDISKFDRKLYYMRGFNELSQLIIEYDFGKDFEPVQIDHMQFDIYPNIDKLFQTNTQDKFMDQLSSKYKVTKRDFSNTFYNIALHQEDGNIEFRVKYVQFSEPLKVSFDFDLGKNKYVRFVPMLCFDFLELNKIVSNSFMSQQNCQLTASQKLLIYKNENNDVKFAFNLRNSVHTSYNLGLSIPNYDIEYRLKKYKVQIKGYEKKCDIVLDKKRQIVYLVSYQQKHLMKKNKIVNANEMIETTNLNFMISENSKHITSKQGEVDHRFLGLLFVSGLVVCGIGVGLLFVNVIVGIIVGLIGLVLLWISWLRNRKFGYSYSEFLTTKQVIVEHSQTMDRLYSQKPNQLVTVPFHINQYPVNIEDLDLEGIPDLDKNIVVENSEKLEELRQDQLKIAEELRIIREEQIIEEDNYTVEEDNEDLNTEMGFNGNEIDFDLNINQNQGESPNSQDFDFLI